MGKQKKNRQGADKTFQRRKVKVGKKLPKSKNVTKTSFKTKTIQIVQQLKKEDEPTTKRKVNIRDLLSQSQHYNVTVRLGAAKGLKELLAVSEETVVAYLGLIVDRVGSLMTDKDCHVREAVLKFFDSLLERVPSNCMSPFFPILCAHLCCAMTHINEEIQQDSLSVFDLILNTYPELIISSSNQLLSNFVEQISKQKFKNRKQDLFAMKSPKLTLSINPNSRLTSQKWQSKVLMRLLKLLSIVLKPEPIIMAENAESIIKFPDIQRKSVPIQKYTKDRWNKPGFVIKRFGMVTSEVLYDIHSIKQLVTNLFPLMTQCWVESHDSEKNDGNLLYPDTISIRTTVLQTILLIVEYGSKNCDDMDVSWKRWLSEKYETLFENYFMSSFPYELLQGKKVKKQENKSSVSPESLNLYICSVMIKFIKNPTEFLLQQSWVQPLVKYIRYTIKSPDVSLDIRRQLLQVLNSLIYAVKPNDQTALLEDCVYRYKNAHPLSQEKQMFINFFSRVSFETFTNSDLPKPLFTFLESLPDLLLTVGQSNGAISSQIVSVVKDAVTWNCTTVVTKWQNYINAVYDPDVGLVTSGSTTLKKSLIELLYWLPVIGSGQLSLLANLIQNDNLTADEGEYIIQVLHQRYLNQIKEETNMDTISDHLGFLIRVLTGSQDLKMKDVSNNKLVTYCDWSEDEKQHLKKQTELNCFICQILCADFQEYDSMTTDVLWGALEKKAGNAEKTDLIVALSFTAVLQTFKYTDKEVSDDLTEILMGFACCLTSAVNQSVDKESEFSYLCTLLKNALCQPYLKQFVIYTTKRFLFLKEETVVLEYGEMFKYVLCLSSYDYILNGTDDEKQFYAENFRKILRYVSDNFPRFKDDKWFCNLEYLTEHEL